MKKALSLLLILVMLLGMMPMTAFATEEAEKNPWEGRSAVFVGDSITAGSGTTKLYYRFLEESLGFGSVTGMGIGGSCISSGSDYGNNNTPLINRYKDIPSADLIQIFMGTNDYGHATPIGSPEDTQASTFYGALHTIIPYLLETHKESKIVFVTPLHRNAKSTGTTSESEYDSNASGHTLHDYVEAIKQVCAMHGVSVIDLYTESEMDPRLDPNNAAYFPDGLHPNAAGHELIAGIMESHIREYEPVKIEPIVQAELIQGNKFSTSNDQPCRASSRVNYYLKAGTVITLNNPNIMQWACARTSNEFSNNNLGYFPDSQWTDKVTAVVAEDGWIGFTFKYRDETMSFDLTRPLSDYITIEEPHTHSYGSTVTAPTCTEQGYTTYTCDCGDSYVADLLDATGHTYENGICTGCGVNEWDTDGDGVLEILAIGNSFSVDALEYAYQIAQNLGIEEIVIGNLYKGSCTLATHAKNAKNNTAAYAWFYNDNGTWSRDTNTWKDGTEKTMSDALQERTWDFVSLQQASGSSGQPDTYNTDLDYLIQYVSDNAPGAKLVWHMTWAYQQNSTHSAFPTYGKDQITMYNAIVSAVQNKIVANENFDLIVPNGTAVQNSRTSLLGDTTTRDGYHMSYDYGRYLTGLLFVKTLTGLDISSVTYAPSGVDAEEMAIAIESVNNAAAKPFAVTKSKYVNEVPDEGYILLQPPIYQGAFWHPQKDGRYNELIDDQSNSPNFFTTIRFIRETLPVGSIITLESGWQYRPDGWVTDELQTGTRESTTTKAFQIVTEEWWGDYTIRSFNISRTSGGSVMDLTEEEMRAIFQIYVPEEKHSHTYENGVCTLCGATQPGPIITQQPESVQQEIGKKFAVTVKAEGEGLTYQWYVKESGAKAFKVSSNKTASYAYTMQTYMHNRQVYCVITDANGHSVQTETATITRPPQALKILEQPKDAQQEIGQKFSISPKVEGEGLTYQWYVKEAGAKAFKVSSIKGSAYALTMQKYMIGRQVYCVITDKYGNSMTTDVATISLPPVELKILEQPSDVFATKGEKFSIKPTVQGDDLTYQWYYKESYMKDFKPSSNKTSAYAYSMQSYMNNRSVYCVITDKYGNQVQTEIVTIHLEK